MYFASEDTKVAAKGFLDLLTIESVEPLESPPWSFRVILDGGRVFDLSADTESERQKWLELLAHVDGRVGGETAAVLRGARAPPIPPLATGGVVGSSAPPPPRPLSPRGLSPRTPAGAPRRDLKDALEGERICSETQYVVVLSGSESVVARGTLFVSNYRIAFVPDLNCADKRVVSIPFGRVRAMQEKTLFDKLRSSLGEFSLLTVVASDGQVLSFGFSKKSANNSLAQFLASYQAVCPASERAVFAFARFAAEPSSEGWDLHDAQNDFERAGWPASFRLTTANACYKMCESYPSSWVVPARVTDEDLAASAGFRSHGRVIACVWYDRESKAPLARCSQPAVGISNNRSLADERIIQCLLESAGTGDCQELQLFDARPKKNALANKAAKGAGYENVAHLKYCTLTFLNIENIHAVRSSWTALLRSCVDDSDDSAFYSNSVSWLTHVGVLLQGAVRVAQALARGTPCLVHCSDGWDRTPQLCCLVMLLNDGYHRTLRGFASMVESQWVAFGHQFALRHGWFSRGESGETAPIFLLFVDCVFQVLDQFPDAFEFNEDFLMALLDGVDSHSFGTFLGHEKLRYDADVKSKTLSIWPTLFANPKYVNRGYAAVKERLEPSTTQRAIKLWRRFFLRHSSEKSYLGFGVSRCMMTEKEERVGFDHLMREFFLQPEYQNVSPEQLVDSASLRDDLWLDELALLELGEFLERHSSVSIKAWDRIETLKDLRAKVGRAANLYRSPSATTLPATVARPIAAIVPAPVPVAAGRSRCVVRVGAWKPSHEEFKRALALVPPERREKVLKFKFESDQRLHLCGRLLLRRLIHQHLKIAYPDISFAYTKGNKPVLGSPLPPGCPFPNFNFNYSHEGELVVGACEPSSIVGVDVAKVEMRGKSKSVEDHFDTMRKCFSSREWALIRGGSDDRDRLYRFFVFWALKESYVKATGWGLGTEFDTIEFREVSFDGPIEDNKRIAVAVDGRLQSDWFFRVRLLDIDHVMAVATGPPSDAAPTFKATFKMAASDPAWRHSVPVDCEVQYLTVPELIEGMPPWKD